MEYQEGPAVAVQSVTILGAWQDRATCCTHCSPLRPFAAPPLPCSTSSLLRPFPPSPRRIVQVLKSMESAQRSSARRCFATLTSSVRRCSAALTSLARTCATAMISATRMEAAELSAQCGQTPAPPSWADWPLARKRRAPQHRLAAAARQGCGRRRRSLPSSGVATAPARGTGLACCRHSGRGHVIEPAGGMDLPWGYM